MLARIPQVGHYQASPPQIPSNRFKENPSTQVIQQVEQRIKYG
jgi:hypothetical protein